MKEILIKSKINNEKRGTILLILQEISILEKFDIYKIKELLEEYGEQGQVLYTSDDSVTEKIAECCEKYGYDYEVNNV